MDLSNILSRDYLIAYVGVLASGESFTGSCTIELSRMPSKLDLPRVEQAIKESAKKQDNLDCKKIILTNIVELGV